MWNLHWLPICRQIQYKIVLLTYKSPLPNQPPYLRNLLHEYQPPHCLCWTSQNLLCIPSCTTTVYLIIWNKLPTTIISQPPHGRCHWASTGQTTLEVIGSKRSYALNWCTPNNDDDNVRQTNTMDTFKCRLKKHFASLTTCNAQLLSTQGLFELRFDFMDGRCARYKCIYSTVLYCSTLHHQSVLWVIESRPRLQSLHCCTVIASCSRHIQKSPW